MPLSHHKQVRHGGEIVLITIVATLGNRAA